MGKQWKKYKIKEYTVALYAFELNRFWAYKYIFFCATIFTATQHNSIKFFFSSLSRLFHFCFFLTNFICFFIVILTVKFVSQLVVYGIRDDACVYVCVSIWLDNMRNIFAWLIKMPFFLYVITILSILVFIFALCEWNEFNLKKYDSFDKFFCRGNFIFLSFFFHIVNFI